MRLLAFAGLLALLATNSLCYGQVRSPTALTRKFKTGDIDINVIGNKVVLYIRKNDGARLRNSLYIKDAKNTAKVTLEQDCELLTTCIMTGNITHTKIHADRESEIITIKRVVNNPDVEIIDCYKIEEYTEWIGGPQLRHQHWPIQHMYYEDVPYVPTHQQNMALAERYWLSNRGIYIYVDEKDPLFLDQNNYKDKHLCLISKNKDPYSRRSNITLNYEIGVYQDSRVAHQNVIKRHFDKPTGHPNEIMVTHPIWSTWARYKVNVNDQTVRKFAEEILSNGFNHSQIEIDDNWETCYGSATFDTKKFPDIKKLLADLKKKKFRVTLWIHPFINEKCNDGESYDYALKNGYFVTNTKGEVHTSWWQGVNAAAIDFTNPKAVAWWVGRLKKLEQLGIDSFKFDAGEVSWLPQPPKLTGPIDLIPGIYTLNYTSNLAKHFDNNIEARVGWKTQGLPMFVRMIDKDTRWTWNNGLPTLITTLLQMNLNGYVFVLPDMIGGNGYVGNSFNDTELPSKEIFIRWLQANVFMPALQYSFVPWDFDAETIAICKTFTDLHAKIAPKIVALMKKAVETGAPVNPPIWWVDPLNIPAHKINDEYLLGEEILVAPVIEQGAFSRDVYLPGGTWKDANTEKLYAGPMWLNNYPAPLNVLPYFYKV
ncbi:hypothetical protein TSAR_004452 [Trichomalopsis sarcophagae]|uniref:Glycoside hydrolase family 31 N-terminal domain-containing protein n=1 Tax=Trichomalopsis sarcophagae TaxID=543379 RepID=A0A232F8W6_9HYME|nr:hypothetical protein TSAR_004452 [Trichomalopsis sarcophagae]